MYIKDAIKAYELIMNSNNNKNQDRIINFGTGIETSILDLANKIIKLCEKDLKPVFVSSRPGEVDRLHCDYSKAKKIYNFSPEYTIDQGLNEFVDWYKNHKSEEWTKIG